MVSDSESGSTTGRPAVELHHTLQTWVGMVQNGGAPAFRTLPTLPSALTEAPVLQTPIQRPTTSWVAPGATRNSLSFRNIVDGQTSPLYTELAAQCIIEGRLPEFIGPAQPRERDDDVALFQANIFACRNPTVTRETLKSLIISRKRVDLEQAAGAVISALINDDVLDNAAKHDAVGSLTRGLRLVLTTSRMWLTDENTGDASTKFARLSAWTHDLLSRYRTGAEKTTSTPAKDWAELLQLLVRIRSSRPADMTRCLALPEWMFTEAGIIIPSAFSDWNARSSHSKGVFPTAAPPPDVIKVSRHHFRALQRRILHYYRFWKAEDRLHHAIHDLEDTVLFCTDFVRERVSDPTTSTLLVAHYFFAYQRRLQRTIVSNIEWTAFLPKGQGMEIMQNNPDIPTTFELTLSKLGGATPGALTSHRDVEGLIDKCCLLMEGYVRLFGNGDRKNLTFQRGVRGGSGRGPVDEYNLLVDILHTLRKDATPRSLKAPGHVQKFLAKDIMAWNNAWGDDAFAGDKVPGWEPWLAERRAAGIELEPFRAT